MITTFCCAAALAFIFLLSHKSPPLPALRPFLSLGMGREWYWSRPPAARAGRESSAPGCMSSVFQLFDFQQLISTATGSGCARPSPSASPSSSSAPLSFQHRKPASNSGVEAPRNSLELELEDADATPSTSATAETEYFDVPLGVQLPESGGAGTKKMFATFIEEERRSPAATPRTPNLLARLMGLDLLPDVAASRSLPPTPVSAEARQVKRSKSKHVDVKRESPPPRQPLQPRNTNALPRLRVEKGCSRSLPDTPRASSARAWDVDPRLSLQINKENSHRAMQEFSYLCEVSAECPSPRLAKPTRGARKTTTTTIYHDENKSQSQSPRSHHYAREIVKQVKDSISNRRCADKSPLRPTRTKPTESKQPPPSSSPPTPKQPQPRPPAHQPPRNRRENVDVKRVNVTPNQGKKPSYERYTERIKNKPTPPAPSPASPAGNKKRNPLAASPAKPEAALAQPREPTRQPERDPEFRYMRSILEHAGILAPAEQMVSWYSPSLPVDPIIFHQLELELPFAEGGLGPLRHRWNRKLLFHLVEEVLSDLLSASRRRPGGGGGGGGEALLLKLWRRVRSFPAADCRVVGDIDALVEGDFKDGKLRELLRRPPAAAEADAVALEIERDLLDTLLVDAARALRACGTR